MNEVEHVKALRRRAAFLRGRIDPTRRGNDWDRAELAAIEWALSIVTAPIVRTREKEGVG